MDSKSLIRFGLLCGFIFYISVTCEPTREAEMEKSKANREARTRVLQEFEEFEAQVRDKITSMITSLQQGVSCLEKDKDKDGVCQKVPPPLEPSQDFDQTVVNLLLDRTENIHGVLLTLILRNFSAFRFVSDLTLRFFT